MLSAFQSVTEADSFIASFADPKLRWREENAHSRAKAAIAAKRERCRADHESHADH